jgi:hypothetical protein
MNEPSPIPPQIAGAPVAPLPPVPPAPPPIAEATEQQPLTGFFATVEALLRQPRRVVGHLHLHRAGLVIAVLLVTTLACGLIYGLVTGTFSGGAQLWAAPVKVALGLLLSGLICLPSLYVFSCLAGSRARLVEVLGLVSGLLALMAVLLLGFAPVAWVFSQSTESVAAMGALHLVFWLVAAIFGVRFLDGGFRQLGVRSLGGVYVWVVILLVVMLQMMAALRPIVGRADTVLPTEKKFFASHWLQCLQGEETDTGRH